MIKRLPHIVRQFGLIKIRRDAHVHCKPTARTAWRSPGGV
jgi:hypothetical protein